MRLPRIHWPVAALHMIFACAAFAQPPMEGKKPPPPGQRTPDEFLQHELMKVQEKVQKHGAGFNAADELRKLEEKFGRDFGASLPPQAADEFLRLADEAQRQPRGEGAAAGWQPPPQDRAAGAEGGDEALRAAQTLTTHGIEAQVIDAYSFPLHAAPLLDRLRAAGQVALTLEDNYLGGLHSAVAEAAAGMRVAGLTCTRIPKSGRTPDEVLAYVGLSQDDIVRKARDLLK